MADDFELIPARQAGSQSPELVPRSRSVARSSRPRAQRPPSPGDLHNFRTILSKHWQVTLTFAVVTVAAVALATFLMKPVYEPEGRLQIDPPGAEVFSMQNGASVSSDAEYIATEAQKLQTLELALATVRALRLSKEQTAPAKVSQDAFADGNAPPTSAEKTAIHELQTHLNVRRDPGSRLVAVQFASHEPKLSAKVVNTLMQLYVERNYQSRHEAIMKSTQWLSRQLDDIRDKMEVSSRKLVEYQKQHSIVEIDDKSTSVAALVADLNKQLVDAQGQRMQMQSYITEIHDPESLPQVRDSAVIQALIQKHAEVKAELAQAGVIYGPNHPGVRKLQRQEEELHAQIVAQRNSIVSELKANYAASRKREQMVQGALQNVTQHLTELEQYASLKKEAVADRQLYNDLYAKIKEAGIAAASKSSNVRVVDEAEVLEHPTRPRRSLNLLFGLLFGLLGGVAVAFYREGSEDRIRTAADVRQWTGLASVAIVPSIASLRREQHPALWGRSAHLRGIASARLLLERPRSPESEALNALRAFILHGRREQPKAMLVTSPLPGEGKTTVASNLAIALAKLGHTCLIDMDLRRPRVANSFHLQNGKGLAELLRGSASLEEVLSPVPNVERLTVIGSRTPSEESAELIGTQPLSELMTQLRSLFDFIIIDTPPILPYAEGRVLSTVVDGIILVGRAAATPRAAMGRAVELLSELRSAPILTVVLNAANFHCGDYRYFYAGY